MDFETIITYHFFKGDKDAKTIIAGNLAYVDYKGLRLNFSIKQKGWVFIENMGYSEKELTVMKLVVYCKICNITTDWVTTSRAALGI